MQSLFYIGLILLPAILGAAVDQVDLSERAEPTKDALLFDPNCDSKWKSLSPNHTMCLSNNPSTAEVIPEDAKKLIVDRHNYLRGHVGDNDAGNNKASNMMKLVWDEEIAKVAGMWAASCVWGHDSHRYLPKFTCGQNGAKFGGHQTDMTHFWEGSVNMWYNEVSVFTYGGSSNFPDAGHFTQVVAALTTRIGCGYAHCTDAETGKKYTTGFCNYGYSYQNTKYPYKAGGRGADCPKSFDAETGLCDCNGLICNYNGNINPDTCTCTCPKSWMDPAKGCEVNCNGVVPFSSESYCKENTERCSYIGATDCPGFCNTCNKCNGKICQNEGELDLATCTCKCDATKCTKNTKVDTEAGDCSCKVVCPGLNCVYGDYDLDACKCKCHYDVSWLNKNDCGMNCDALVPFGYEDFCKKNQASCSSAWLGIRYCPGWCNVCKKCDGKICKNGGQLDLSTCKCKCDASKCTGNTKVKEEDCSCEEACPGLTCVYGTVDTQTCKCTCSYDVSWLKPNTCEMNCEALVPFGYEDFCKSNQASCSSAWLGIRYCPGWCNVCKKCNGKICKNGGQLDLSTCQCKCDASKCTGNTKVKEDDCSCVEACPGLVCVHGTVDTQTCKCTCKYDVAWLDPTTCEMNCQAVIPFHYDDWCKARLDSCSAAYLGIKWCPGWCKTCKTCGDKTCDNKLDQSTCTCVD